MALGITLLSKSSSTLEVEATGFSSAINVINWYIDNVYDGSVSSNQSSWPTWEFTGLDPNTSYTIKAAFYISAGSAAADTALDSFSTEPIAYSQKITYRSGSASVSQTIQGDGNLLTGEQFTAPVDYAFYGWATSTGTTSITYEGGEYYEPDSSSNMTLYAVWRRYVENGIVCYYGLNQSSENYRNFLSWKYNSSSTSQKTAYESITLPNLTAGNVSAIGRSFSPIGWRSDTTADDAQYAGGGTATPSGLIAYYAVYANSDGVGVYYNANGGTGTMSDATVAGTIYYNTSGKNSTLKITPRACTFTPPSKMTFAGWATSSDGDILEYVNTAYTITFYAIWKSARPDDWVWSGKVTVGGTTYNVPLTGGQEVPTIQQADGTYYAYFIGASEWNQFVSRVNAFCEYCGEDQITAAATAGYEMSASTANTVINAVNAMAGTSIPEVGGGYVVSASLFTNLADALNSIE